MGSRREIHALRRCHEEALDLLSRRDRDLFVTRERVSRWSLAQHIHHLGLVNQVIYGHIARLMQSAKGDVDGMREGGRVNWIGRLVLLTGRIPRGRGKAPESVQPAGDSGREPIVEILTQTRDELDGIAAGVDRLSSLDGRVRHFAFGDLTAAQWLKFSRIHSRHHLRIVDDIRRDEG